jgi:predicted acetyltransferase
MAIEIRPLTTDEIPNALQLMARYFLVEPPTEARITNAQECWAPDRQFAAFDGGRVVAMAGVWPLSTTVPGLERLPTMGLTRVGVASTHRRRGILTALLRAQFDDSLRRGDVISSLRASEAAIYGRFGYGLGGNVAKYRIKTPDSAFATPIDDSGSMRLLEPNEVMTTLPGIYDRVGRNHVGAIDRSEGLWRNYLGDFASDPFASAHWVAVHVAADGTLDGYVDFEATDRDNWERNGNLVHINDLVAADPVVYAALWRFVCDYDLVGTVESDERPTDEPIRWRLANPRALEVVERYDEQWVRLLNVDAALRQRAYNGDGSVVVNVTDSFAPANTGTYRLGADAGRTDAAPDLSLDVSMLGAAYLGGTSFAELAAASRIVEHTAGAAARADALCASPRAPWCGSFF